MGLLRIMMPPKFQLLAVLAFGVAMLFLENQVQKLEESRGKLVFLQAFTNTGVVHVNCYPCKECRTDTADCCVSSKFRSQEVIAARICRKINA
ncbi:UNVERIFIED_CONTAM: hypothetical protein FKN15_046851 [Acipenser sinensis]